MPDAIPKKTPPDRDRPEPAEPPRAAGQVAASRRGASDPHHRAVPAPPPLPSWSDDPEEPTGVRGTLREMQLPEVLQSLAHNRKDALVEVRPRERDAGVVYVEGGRVVFCQTGPLLGEPALFALLPARRGAFRVRYGRRTDARNIDRELAFLLLEGARHIDELSAPHLVSPKTVDDEQGWGSVLVATEAAPGAVSAVEPLPFEAPGPVTPALGTPASGTPAPDSTAADPRSLFTRFFAEAGVAPVSEPPDPPTLPLQTSGDRDLAPSPEATAHARPVSLRRRGRSRG